MSLPVLILCYAVSAATLVLCSIKCANYVDLLDKKTNISGAFIGGAVLAAVTSLPELITSISSIYVVHNPELIIGNVLGSNIFNLCIFGGLTAIFATHFSKAKVAHSHMKVIICTLVAYALTAGTMYLGRDGQNFGRIPVIYVNAASLLILVVYFISMRFLSTDDSESDEEDTSPLTVKQVIVRFCLVTLLLVGISVVVTYFTDCLSEQLNLQASLAGALFLGVATSLPELTSSIALVRLKNFNAMIGNVIGSNMFNYTIFSIADILAGSTVIYVASHETMLMIIFGAVSALLVMTSLLIKRRYESKPLEGVKCVPYTVLGALVIASYIGSLLLSM